MRAQGRDFRGYEGNYFPIEGWIVPSLNVDQSTETIPSWKPFYLFSINLLNAVTRRIFPRVRDNAEVSGTRAGGFTFSALDSREINDELDRSGRNTVKKEKQVKAKKEGEIQARWSEPGKERTRTYLPSSPFPFSSSSSSSPSSRSPLLALFPSRNKLSTHQI